MNDKQIDIIHKSSDSKEISDLLKSFLSSNESSFIYPNNYGLEKKNILWTCLFQKICSNVAEVQYLSLAVIRILSRDKEDIEQLICDQWMLALIEKADLNDCNEEDDASLKQMSTEHNIVVEAMKCLCNIAFNSDVARALCARRNIEKGLLRRIANYKSIPYKNEVILFDMKLLFILTALRPDIKEIVILDNGMNSLVNCVEELVPKHIRTTEDSSEIEQLEINEPIQQVLCQILKVEFNLILHLNSDDKLSENEDALFKILVPQLAKLLSLKVCPLEKKWDLHSDVINLLTSIPVSYFPLLTPELKDNEQNPGKSYNGRNIEALHTFLLFLERRLSDTTEQSRQYENLSPILTVLNKCARTDQRKFLRQSVLPPLKDVSTRPETGDMLRNKLCRLLTTPVMTVRDLVAEFLFVLCKENVGRMVKYTGFGNAAGHLAQKGLLGGGPRGLYSSSSDDSDTEEYLSAQHNIDPVVGCTRPDRPSPFEGMTEEQKEYEAMKLANLFDELLAKGIVKPARVGADGRPEPVEHVLELRDQPPKRPQS